ncbi:hypothetical protein G6F40_016831 [Rhizopus arrhizus]|nr:hypothetical protein G6F40_016831 [Rhizopus arrhizus]
MPARPPCRGWRGPGRSRPRWHRGSAGCARCRHRAARAAAGPAGGVRQEWKQGPWVKDTRVPADAASIAYARRMSRPATDTAPAAATGMPRPRALLVWRGLAMVYDALPVLALWMLAGTLFTLAYTLSGHAQRENIAPFSAWQ